MQVSSYKDFPVNHFQVCVNGTWVNKYPKGTRFWKTAGVATILPGRHTKGCIGRVDHFKKKSIAQIVRACIKNVIVKEGKLGRHTIDIRLREDWDYDNNQWFDDPQTMQLTITVIV